MSRPSLTLPPSHLPPSHTHPSLLPLPHLSLLLGKSMSSVSLTNPAPDWIDGRMWAELTALSALPTFVNLAQDVRNKSNCFNGTFLVSLHYTVVCFVFLIFIYHYFSLLWIYLFSSSVHLHFITLFYPVFLIFFDLFIFLFVFSYLLAVHLSS